MIDQQVRGMSRLGGFRNSTPPVAVPVPTLDSGQGPVVPFRRGTTEKTTQLTQESFTALTTTVQFNRVVEENGFLYGIVLDVVATTALNSAAVTFVEDAPYAALNQITLADVAGELVNLQGFDLFIANLAGRQYAGQFWSGSNELFTLSTGSLAAGGSLAFMLRLPVGINRRSLSGIVGNQDRSTKYMLRTDYAASASIYTTSPSTLPPVTITKIYEKYTVPAPDVMIGRSRVPQQQIPDDYGRLHFTTATNFSAAPVASGTQNHYLTRIGNTVRYIGLIFRAGSGTNQRQLAQNNTPTSITFKIGDDSIFTETWRYRRSLMFERYGFDFPDGVLVYDMMHDFTGQAGAEMGEDWYYTQGLNNAQFIIAYPSGFTTAGATLRAVTDDLQEVPVNA